MLQVLGTFAPPNLRHELYQIKWVMIIDKPKLYESHGLRYTLR